eukprot:3069565-Rhodomonas_salina.1
MAYAAAPTRCLVLAYGRATQCPGLRTYYAMSGTDLAGIRAAFVPGNRAVSQSIDPSPPSLSPSLPPSYCSKDAAKSKDKQPAFEYKACQDCGETHLISRSPLYARYWC